MAIFPRARERQTFAPILFLSLFILGVSAHCANVVPPGGGPKDEVPPKIVKTFPLQESVLFQGTNIKITFDKRIEVRDLYNKLVITPKLKKKDKPGLKKKDDKPELKKKDNKPGYTYKVRGRTLKIKLKQPLEENTTYTFNFNDAVRDLTEGNVAKNPMLTFSTGEQLDNMYAAGKVQHLMTAKPAAEALVSLYRVGEDNVHILNSPPDYFIKADQEGNFKLEHIKKGQYYIYASDSKEKLVADAEKHAYGFLNEAIDLKERSMEGITLSITKADVREFKLMGQQPQDQYFEISFSKPVKEYTLVLSHPSKRFKDASYIYSHLIDKGKGIRVYNTLGLLGEDSLEVSLTAKDVMGNTIQENIFIRFREGKRATQTPTYTFLPATGAAIKPEFEGKMTVSKPAKEVKVDLLSFVFNGQNSVPFSPEEVQFNAQRTEVTIKKKLNPAMLTPKKGREKAKKEKKGARQEKKVEEGKFILDMKEGAFVTVEGDKSPPKSYTYTFKDPKADGTIKGTVAIDAPGFIIQLLDPSYQVVRELRNERHYQFKELAPGNYRLRLLILQDKEGDWSFGNINQRIPPDPVMVYPDEIAVIANWEVGEIDFRY